jgi:NADH-quinone oxidoreductase subunit C
VAPEAIEQAANAVKEAGYNFLEDVAAVDWLPAEPRFEVCYHILSHALKERIRLRAFLGGAEPSIATVTPVWPSANFFEREIFDLFGIDFAGHPNQRRILMPDEWQGHPLRKDYPVEGYR